MAKTMIKAESGMTGIFDGRLDGTMADAMAAQGIRYGISLGRRAPLHKMHLDCILEIVKAGLVPVIVIGSVNGADDSLYDPLRNPLTLEQQYAQLCEALPPEVLKACKILTLPDQQNDAAWLKSLNKLLADNGMDGKSVMHFRAKAADAAVSSSARCRPLSQYKQDLRAAGIAVWQSYNADSADDLICATDLRRADLSNADPVSAERLPALESLRAAVVKARATNPDRKLLEKNGVAPTVLDLTFDRLRRETGLRTRDLVLAAKLQGSVSYDSLLAVTGDKIERMKRKPLILVGPRMGRETGMAYVQDNRFDFVPASVGMFQSGETFSELFPKDEANSAANADRIKGAHVYVVQSTAAPVSDNVQHLLHMIHTLKFYGAEKVTAVMPFTAYARQDRAFANRFASVGGDMLPRQLKAAGADAVIGVTLHSKASMEFYRAAFGKNFTPISTAGLFAAHLQGLGLDTDKIVVGAPDGGEKTYDEGIARARDVQSAFNAAGMFKISKVRVADSAPKITSFEGEVQGRTAVLVDDMVDGGSTLVNAARVLKQNGAAQVVCCVSHGLLTPGRQTALEKLLGSTENGAPLIDRFVVTDSVPDVHEKLAQLAVSRPDLAAKVDILPLAPLLTAAMQQKPRTLKRA